MIGRGGFATSWLPHSTDSMTRQGRRRRGEAVYPWLGMTAVLSVSFRLTLFAVVCLLHHHPHLNFLCVQAHFGLDFLFAGFSNSTSMHCMEYMCSWFPLIYILIRAMQGQVGMEPDFARASQPAVFYRIPGHKFECSNRFLKSTNMTGYN